MINFFNEILNARQTIFCRIQRVPREIKFRTIMSLQKKKTVGVNVHKDIEILDDQIEDKKLILEYLQKK